MRQLITCVSLNLLNIRSRIKASRTTIIGFAAVVMVLSALLSIQRGFEFLLQKSATDDTAIVLAENVVFEIMSRMQSSDLPRLRQIVNEAQGKETLLIPEMLTTVNVAMEGYEYETAVSFRGVSEGSFEFRPAVSLIDGRMFQTGLNEVVVGKSTALLFPQLKINEKIRWGTQEWTVVGIMESGGSIYESEIWADIKTLQTAYQRGNSVQAIRFMLESDEALETINETIANDPQITLGVHKESELMESNSKQFFGFISAIGTIIAGIMGAAAIFGAINTMYTNIQARIPEISTLRVLGFRRSSILFSILVEGVLLGLVGGGLGVAVAYFVFDGFTAGTTLGPSKVTIAFAVTQADMLFSIGFATVLGLIGSMIPSIRAFRLPVIVGIRE